MIIVDTNVVSELMKTKPAPQVKAWADSVPDTLLAVTSITLAELLHGIKRLPPGRRRDDLSTALDVLLESGLQDRVLPFDAHAADQYARLRAAGPRAGASIDPFDVMICAIALARGDDIATRNVDDFAGQGVAIINPWAALPAPL